MSNNRVFLWTAPRCVSTAFERSIMTLKNSVILHEPFSVAFYFGPERQSPRYASQEPNQQATYRSISKLLQKEYDGKDFLFSKEMAYCLENKFHLFSEEGFKTFKHTFLIRHPLKAVYSLYKASTNPKLTGWNCFYPAEAGFRQMAELYEFVERNIHKDPIVIDADDLLDYPNQILKSYCEAVGLEYDENMTSWEPGPVPEWEVWAGWHEDALKSSGFRARVNKNRNRSRAAFDIDDLPTKVATAVEECLPYYKMLFEKRIRPKNTEPC
ncbi:uncharacterized protein LOC141892513 [Acropora palmata]|uniref:uncharacterized protein LOC141892513 n=1 Tax=Acropora palmata TaxID=6131 RepID=UPI003DA09AEE